MVNETGTVSRHETGYMPTPGTLAHLEYLSGLEVDDESYLTEARSFLEETMAATSLARIIRRHRSYWPMRNQQTADLDTRLMNVALARPNFFRGSIGVSRILPDHNQLLIHSKHDWHSYDIVIPVNRAHHYDPARPIQASYLIKQMEKGVETQINWVYNEAAAPEYEEHDPQVLISAVQEAAEDLMRVLGHTPGDIKYPSDLESSDIEFPIWPDGYLDDKPDEFRKKPREQW
jgi:hypothetical protein